MLNAVSTFAADFHSIIFERMSRSKTRRKVARSVEINGFDRTQLFRNEGKVKWKSSKSASFRLFAAFLTCSFGPNTGSFDKLILSNEKSGNLKSKPFILAFRVKDSTIFH